MDYKKETLKVYNTRTQTYSNQANRTEYLEKYLLKEVNEFLHCLPEHAKILDLGNGDGEYALYFQNKGYDLFCIDLSEEMVKRCKQKGLKTKLMEFEHLDFPPNSFDGIWAYASLHHTPKEKVDSILKALHQVLKPNGAMFIGILKGTTEGFLEKDDIKGRWFARYTDQELRPLLEQYFAVKSYSETHGDDTPTVYLNYALVKKEGPNAKTT